ncbi:11354_t:CDS:1, partial [Ambispora leptoticha]
PNAEIPLDVYMNCVYLVRMEELLSPRRRFVPISQVSKYHTRITTNI